MKKLPLLVLILAVTLVVSLAFAGQSTQALPEYSAQTGEPCASCHISPSGGGLRTPRGQAWVGAGKPGAVPNLTDSLALLGVKLDIDQSAFEAVSQPIGQAQKLHHWLKDYQGN
jgi:hypothetical protein